MAEDLGTSLLLTTATALLLLPAVYAERETVLALEDNFEDFDLSLWKHELTLGGGGNWEFQAYTNNRTNSFTEDGVLHFHPTLLADIIGEQNVRGGFRYDIWGASPADLCTGNAFYGCERRSGAEGGGNYLNPIVSARIRTAESFSFKYGKVEVRAKLPIGDWLWPAIWLLPRDNQYGGWPASGEINIMESRGNSPDYGPGGYDKFGSTLHWGPDYTENKFLLTHAEKSGTNWAEDFHTYGLIWNESYIGTYVDDEDNVVLSVNTYEQSFWERGGFGNSRSNPWRGQNNSAPFDQPFYLIINLAVGGLGGYFPDLGTNDPKPWHNNEGNPVNDFYDAKDKWLPTWTQDFEIDSVKVWTYPDQRYGVYNPAETSTAGRLVTNFLLIVSSPASFAGLCLLLAAVFLKL